MQTIVAQIRKLDSFKNIPSILVIAVAPFITALLIVLGVNFISKAGAGDAKLVMMPETGRANVGENTTTQIYLFPEGNQVRGIDVILEFDPQYLNATAITATSGSGFPTFLSHMDNTLGKAEFSALTFDSSTGTPTAPVGGTAAVSLATVRFRALKAGEARVTFRYTAYQATDDSNVIIISGEDVIDVLEQPTTTLSFTHNVCDGSGQCVSVSGIGLSDCSSSVECSHKICDQSFQCVSVIGKGTNACQASTDCSHKVCDQSYRCVSIAGAGQNACSTNADCALPTHKACNAEYQCVSVSGAGQDACQSNADCAPATHKACNANYQCVSVTGSGQDSCSDDASCRHFECNTSYQCVSVGGVGQNACQQDGDCAPKNDGYSCDYTSFQCNTSLNCVISQGAGNCFSSVPLCQAACVKPPQDFVILKSNMQARQTGKRGGSAVFTVRKNNSGVPQEVVVSKTIALDGAGSAVASFKDWGVSLTAGEQYFFYLKGYQHLAKRLLAAYNPEGTLDFGTLLAGDVYIPNESGAQDSEVNSVDASKLVDLLWVTAKDYYDLNSDGEINSVDLSLIITNWFKEDE